MCAILSRTDTVRGLCILPMALLITAPIAAQDDPALPVANHIVVDKTARTIVVFADGAPVRTITGIRLGDAPRGHKRFQGDERTPEGRYVIDYSNPQSAFYLSLHISYPNAADRAFAASQGRSPGGDIFIHGQPNGRTGHIARDWTDGCIAVSNKDIEWLWQTVPDGTPIDILP